MATPTLERGRATTPDGVNIAYQVSGQGPALVCCHAMGSDHRMYDAHRGAFSEQYTLITFDQRGAGDSDHPPFSEGPDSFYTADKFGSDLQSVLDTLGIARARVLGYSMGAVAALVLATRHPDRVERLALVSAMASRLPQPIIDRARLVEAMLDQEGIAKTYDFYYSGSLFAGLMADREFRRLVAQGRDKATYDGFKGCFRVTIDRPSLVGRLARIACPTLVLVGADDTHYIDESKLLAQEIENAERLVMPAVGHPLAFQDPRAFEHAVLSFMP